jgi:hypothetical protein
MAPCYQWRQPQEQVHANILLLGAIIDFKNFAAGVKPAVRFVTIDT